MLTAPSTVPTSLALLALARVLLVHRPSMEEGRRRDERIRAARQAADDLGVEIDAECEELMAELLIPHQAPALVTELPGRYWPRT